MYIIWNRDLDHVSEWTEGEDGEDMPSTYSTLAEARAAIADCARSCREQGMDAPDEEPRRMTWRYLTRNLQRLREAAGRTN